MRLWPASLAGRTTAVLLGGLLLVLLLTVVTASLLLFDDARPRQVTPLTERVLTLTHVLEQLPAHARPAALAGGPGEGMVARWTRDPGDAAVGGRSWGTLRLQRHLRQALQPLGVQAVRVGPPVAAGSKNTSAVRVAVMLRDGSWLVLDAARDWYDPWRPVRLGLVLAVFASGIVALAVWVARRTVAPLRRFAAAASRFGTDLDAPPLAEEGPSELRHAAIAFNQMQERIRRFIEERTLTLAAISHDLRTSLTRLRLRAEFIDDPEQQAKAIADLDEMQAMLEATLAFAKDEAAIEPLTRLDLATLLKSLCDDLADAGQPVAYTGPDRLGWIGRPVALRRAFANLIENALRYGREAEVALARREDQAEVTVADRGPGIPEHLRERVFDPFFRLDRSRSRETGGTGLGLAIARAIIHRHGGAITLADRAGGGLIVRVALPAPP